MHGYLITYPTFRTLCWILEAIVSINSGFDHPLMTEGVKTTCFIVQFVNELICAVWFQLNIYIQKGLMGKEIL